MRARRNMYLRFEDKRFVSLRTWDSRLHQSHIGNVSIYVNLETDLRPLDSESNLTCSNYNSLLLSHLTSYCKWFWKQLKSKADDSYYEVDWKKNKLTASSFCLAAQKKRNIAAVVRKMNVIFVRICCVYTLCLCEALQEHIDHGDLTLVWHADTQIYAQTRHKVTFNVCFLHEQQRASSDKTSGFRFDSSWADENRECAVAASWSNKFWDLGLYEPVIHYLIQRFSYLSCGLWWKSKAWKLPPVWSQLCCGSINKYVLDFVKDGDWC